MNENRDDIISRISSELQKVIDTYSSLFIGRERSIRLIVLALMSKQHIYMISPPGTGKTMLENVARSFDMSVFYYLYNYDTKLEDILYNPIIRRQAAGDSEKIIIDYELKNPGLGTCDIHFADEMFKAPTEVLNALLGAMNERRVTLGSKEYKIPLWTLVAASNELPEEASALLDRFLFRDFLNYLPEEKWYDYLIQYWRIHQPDFERVVLKIDKNILEEAYGLLWSIDVFSILEDYLKILRKVKEKGIEVSDRRKGRILQALAASAILNGRDTVMPEDLEVLLYTIPTNPDEYDVVVKVVDEYLGGLLKVREELENLANQLRETLATMNSMKPHELADILENTIPKVRRVAETVNFPSLERYAEKILKLAQEVYNQAVDKLADKLIAEG